MMTCIWLVPVPSTLCSTSCFNNTTPATSGTGCITKFNSSQQVSWATGFGTTSTGLYQTTLTGIAAADLDNSVYMVGYSASTSNNFPITYTGSQYHQTYAGGNADGIVIEFDQNDNLVYCTFMGGGDEDEFNAAALNLSDNIGSRVYICGYTKSTDFPTYNGGGTPPAYFQSTSYTGTAGFSDGVFVDLNTNNIRNYATYYGGTGTDVLTDVTVLPQTGGAYITGNTNSIDLPSVTPTNFYSQSYAGSNSSQDGLIANYLTGDLNWSTYFGGSKSNVAAVAKAVDFMVQLKFIFPLML